MLYIEQNLKEFETCNIPLWWSKGYTGKGIKIAELETNVNPEHPCFDSKVKTPFGHTSHGHGGQVLDVMHQVAPDADLYALPNSKRLHGNKAEGRFFDETIPYIIKEGIDIVGASLAGTDHPIINQAILGTQEKGVVWITSAGNEGKDGVTEYAKSNVWIGIGAVHLLNNNRIIKASYSSIGKDLDFMLFSNLYVHGATRFDIVFPKQGTSFSSPMACGMIALVQQFFNEKTGKKLNQKQVYQFMLDHTKDMGNIGFDEYYGYGLFVLPDPDDINVNKYIGGNNMEIKMQIGNKKYYIDGKEKEMDVAPVQLYDSRTFVPVRFVAEALGCEVDWEEETKTVTIKK